MPKVPTMECPECNGLQEWCRRCGEGVVLCDCDERGEEPVLVPCENPACRKGLVPVGGNPSE